MKCKTFNYKNYKKCYFEVGNYLYNSQSIFINIMSKEGEELYTCTVNMPDYFYSPNTATIKNYGENAGMTKFLQKLGVVETVYSSRQVNSMALESETIDFCEINIEKLKEYSDRFDYEFTY